MIGTFGTFGQTITFTKDKKQKKRNRKPKAETPGDRFKCSRCTVKTDNEEVIISHIISVNECKAGYYTDNALGKCCSDGPRTLACLDCPNL